MELNPHQIIKKPAYNRRFLISLSEIFLFFSLASYAYNKLEGGREDKKSIKSSKFKIDKNAQLSQEEIYEKIYFYYVDDCINVIMCSW